MKMDQVIGNQVPETMPIKTSTLPDNLSPQCIGREFVRCYYTLLHDNPNKLHRFYLDQSTFVHGNQTDGTAECVTGQRAIHEKIMSLKFEDCRTKIKHVDSQATIDDGVVVQVSGELSNAGQLPRRFMQTFVLGSQTPRKYYVHNDIFRYQDEVFGYDHEDGCEDDVNSLSSQEDINDNVEINNEDIPVADEPEDVEEVEPEETTSLEEQPNGDVTEESLLNNHDDVTDTSVQECQHHEVEEAIESTDTHHEPKHVPEEPEYEPEPEVLETMTEPEVEEEIPEPEPEKPKGPKSWAMIAGSGSGAQPPRATSQPKPARVVIPKPSPVVVEPKEIPHKKETTFQPFHKESEAPRVEGSGSRGGRRGPKENNRERSGGFNNNFRDRFQERDAPNSHQVFVGNLPNATKHEDLQNMFKKYGNVIHVRVTPNNFGFVVFENDGPVQDILGAVREGEKFFLHDQRLNIEEKKTAMNNSRGPRKPFNEQRGNRRGRRGGPIGRSYNDHNSDLK